MEKREINPTEWLLAFNLNQGIEVTGGGTGALSVWANRERCRRCADARG